MINETPATLSATPQAVRLGMISNPNSGRNRRHLSTISAMLDLTPGAFHIVTARSEDIALAMTELGRAGVNVLAINGGDGRRATRRTDSPASDNQRAQCHR